MQPTFDKAVFFIPQNQKGADTVRGAFTFEGKRYYVSGKDEKEIAVNKALRLKELEEGKIIESNMLVRDWAQEWMQTYKIAVLSDEQYKDYQTA